MRNGAKMDPSTIGGAIMKALSATAALVMTAGWTLLPGSAPSTAPKERNYSVPVQSSYRCDCSGERGCISRTQCLDTGGRCGKDC